jgi:CheY-like chemotaxis protein
VLVVDDSELVTSALAVLLDASGYRTRTATSVTDALRVARDEPPDAMLVDLTLPDGDGLQIVRALAADGRSPRASIALTGHDDPDTEARCLAAGCRAVLVKPVRAAALIAGLRDWLDE